MAVENRRVERRRLGLYCNGLVATEMCMCLCMGEAGGGWGYNDILYSK